MAKQNIEKAINRTGQPKLETTPNPQSFQKPIQEEAVAALSKRVEFNQLKPGDKDQLRRLWQLEE